MKKTLIILAHPDLTRSMANKKLKEIAEKNTVLVGNFMGNEYSKSKLYDKAFSHEFRKGIKFIKRDRDFNITISYAMV